MKTSLLTVILLSWGLLSYSQQVPNGGFETWKTTTFNAPLFSISYEEPEGWQTLNAAVLTNENKPVSKSREKTSGSYSLLAQTQQFASVFAIIDTAIGFAVTKFKVSQIPSSISFNYKSDIKGLNDTVFVSAISSKWNSRTSVSENIGIAIGAYTISQPTFKLITLPFFGLAGVTPDSITIIISSSGKIKKNWTPGTSLWIDDLFVNYGPLNLNDNQNSVNDVNIFPSPASGVFYVADIKKNAVSYALFDSQGTEVKKGLISDPDVTEINVERQPKGLYFIETYNAAQIRTSRNKITIY